MQSNIIIYIPAETPHLAMKRILGVPLFLRGPLNLHEAGYSRLILIAPMTERRHILKSWEHHTRGKNLKPHFIWTAKNHLLDAANWADILQNSGNEVTWINANLLFGASTLEPWNNIQLRNSQHLKAVIDRGLPPLVRVTRHDLEKMELKTDPLTIEQILDRLIRATTAHPHKWSETVKLITRFTPLHEAASYLTDRIRQATPMWIARNINKRISLPISTVLAKLRIHPNTITIFNMLIGMAASIGAAGKTYKGLLIGGILFQLASIIDGCDGEVAKLTHTSSKFGQYIDSVSDNLALAGFFTGLMIHEYRVSDHSPLPFVWGAFLLTGLLILFGIMINFLQKNTDSASFVTFDKEYLQKLPADSPRLLLAFIRHGKYFLKKDFFSMLIFVLALFGVLPWMFYIAAIACWTGVGVLLYLRLRSNPLLKEARKEIHHVV